MNARFLSAIALSATIVGLTPHAAFADVRYPPRIVCSGILDNPEYGAERATAADRPRDARFEAHGNGYTSLGAFSFTLFKTSGAGGFHGCLTLTAPERRRLWKRPTLAQGSLPTRTTFRLPAARSHSRAGRADSRTRAAVRRGRR